ncbi:MerR family transcriptional regulator [Candidatus Solincola sp.]|nr:TetR family transcriptional regulator [Actinomycetota bacterium]
MSEVTNVETDAQVLRMSDLERLSGIPRHTIHQYIRRGLLPPPVKTGKTSAYYNEIHLEGLKKIREIKGGSRLPLSYLKRLLDESGAENGKGEETAIVQGEHNHREDEKEKKRRRIREAALELFVRKGYGGTKIKDITSRAGVSVGTFYLYYRDKKELFMDAVDELIQSVVHAIEKEASRDGDPFRKAIRTARFYLDNYSKFSVIINQLRGMMVTENPDAYHKYIALHKRIADPVVRELRNAAKRGLIRDLDPELLARAVMGIVEFTAIFLTFDRRYDSGEAVAFIVDLLKNGLRVSKE